MRNAASGSASEIDPQPRSETPKPKLLDHVRIALRSRHYSKRTEHTYVHWIKRFIFFHKLRHPAQVTEVEVNAFLSPLAIEENVSPSTRLEINDSLD